MHNFDWIYLSLCHEIIIIIIIINVSNTESFN